MPACPQCGEENPERAKFCLACGQALGRHCPACGAENPERAKFCLECGARLAAPAATQPVPREVRKTVTIVFCDVAGSTALGEKLDPESLRRVMGRYFDEMRAALERHGGTVEKFIGDAVMAVFGIPVVHEDDALRAVRAASEMREARVRLNEALQRQWGVGIEARIGINTGEVVAGDSSEGQRFATGDTVNVAARLEQAAPGGEILIGDVTYSLVRDAVRVEPIEPLALKGKSKPVPAYRLVEVLAGVEGVGRRHDAPLVGRDRELRRLGEIFARVRSDPTCWMVTVLGAAGLGKSRLVSEFVADARGSHVLGGRCLPYGEGITFWPVLEIVRAAAGITEADSPDDGLAKIGALVPDEIARDRVAAAIGLAGGTGSVEETFWGVRRLVETLAAERPLVLGFDDIHWAEPTLLDLIEYLSGWIRESPVLILCQARPDLLESRPGWGTAANQAVIALEPLSAEQSTDLVGALLGSTELPGETRARIVEAAGGNPLFVEQMLAMIGDDVGGDVVVPPTIQALLAARLDRLDPDERSVIERASIEGSTFHRGAVHELGAADALPQLMTLVRRELIRPARAAFPGEDAFSFHHLLIRDAAYEAMPKQARAELHERFAGWLERTAGERVREYEEILGYHLEQAHRYRTALGPADERARELGRRAAAKLSAAGRRAHDRDDSPATASLLGRAAALLPEDDPERVALLPDLAAALRESGELERAQSVLVEARKLATAAGDDVLGGYAALELMTTELLVDPEADVSRARREAEALVELFERLGDELGLTKAWRALANLAWFESRSGETERCAVQVIEHARRAGRRGDELDSLAWLAVATCFGPTPAAEGVARCDELLEQAAGVPGVEATILTARAQLEAMLGNAEAARSLLARSLAIVGDLGNRLLVAGTSMNAGLIELVNGQPALAERELRRSHELLAAIGERSFLSTAVGYLARAVYDQGRHEEADTLSRECEAAAAPDDVASQVAWRAVRGKVHARRGSLAEGERLVRRALEVARRTDFVDVIATTHADLAEVLELAGRRREARDELERALELYVVKENVAVAARVRSRLEADPRAAIG